MMLILSEEWKRENIQILDTFIHFNQLKLKIGKGKKQTKTFMIWTVFL